MKRRKFLENSSKAVIASTLLPVNAVAAPARNNVSQKIKVALVGTGTRGTGTWGYSLLNSGQVPGQVLCPVSSVLQPVHPLIPGRQSKSTI